MTIIRFICCLSIFLTVYIQFSVLNAGNVPKNREQIYLSFANVVEKTAPSVVNIYTKIKVKRRRHRTLFDDPFFNRFFGTQV